MRRNRTVLLVLALLGSTFAVETVRADSFLAGFDDPTHIAVNPVTGRTYVVDEDDGYVAVYEGTDLTTRRTITIGFFPSAIAVNPRTNEIWVVSGFGNAIVTCIDGETETTQTITLGGLAGRVAINAVTNTVYVGHQDGLYVIDGATKTFELLSFPGSVYGIAVDPIRNRVWYRAGSSVFAIIDGVTHAAQFVSTGGLNAFRFTYDAVRDRLYGVGSTFDDMFIIDGSDLSVSTVPVGAGPNRIAMNPLTNEIWVANQGASTVTVVDGATLATRTIALAAPAAEIVIDAARNRVFVGTLAPSIAVVNGDDDSIRTVPMPSVPSRGGAVDPVSGRCFMSLPDIGTVATIDGYVPEVASEFIDWVYQVYVDEIGRRIFVADRDDVSFGIRIIDLDTGAMQRVALPDSASYPFDVDPFENKLYAVTSAPGASHLLVLDLDTFDQDMITMTRPNRVIAETSRNRIWASSMSRGYVYVVDGEDYSFDFRDLGFDFEQLVWDRANDRFIAYSRFDRQLTTIDPIDYSLESHDVFDNSGLLEFDFDSERAYGVGVNDVTAIDLRDFSTETRAVNEVASIQGMVLNPVTNKIYVYGEDETVFPNEVLVIEIDGEDLLDRRVMNLGVLPVPFTFFDDQSFIDTVRNRLYVVIGGDDSEIAVVDLAEGSYQLIDTGWQNVRGFEQHAESGRVLVRHSPIGDDPGALTTLQARVPDAGLDVDTAAFGGVRSYADRTVLRFDDASTVWPGADRVFFQVDTHLGEWQSVDISSGFGIAETEPIGWGYHVLYAYATDGQESGDVSDPSRSMIGHIRAYPFVIESDCASGTIGAGSGTTADVLFLNAGVDDNPGTRAVEVGVGDSITGSIVKPPAGGPGKFLVHANLSLPTGWTFTPLPAKIGNACFPMILPQGATPDAIWNKIGKVTQVGASTYFDGSPIPDPARAPTDFLVLPTGDAAELPAGTTVTFQGVILDPDSPSPKGASTTNAVILTVMP